jgi:HSP20 family protein
MVLSFDPNDRLPQLQSVLDRFFRNPASGFEAYGAARDPGVFPAINIFSEEHGIVVRAEVPGVRSDDLDVTVEQGRLVLSGEREETERKGGSYHRRERPVGRFSRSIRLPDDLDASACKATCRNGVLTIRIPRHEHLKPRKVSIE